MASSENRTWVGVDVSKNHWDVAVADSKAVSRFVADPEGTQRLIDFVGRCDSPHVCLEATGGHERPLVQALHEAAVLVSVVNPAHVRHFARAHGQLAKTDRIDARLLARFGALMQPHPSEQTSENQRKLKALRTRRQQLSDGLVQEKNRLSVTRDGAARRSIEETIEFYQQQLQSLDEQIGQLMQVDPQFQRRLALLTSVPGVGPNTAAALMADLPELGSLNRRQAARLVGLAPINRDSGAFRGKRMIGGGRATVRKGLYMATLVATRHNSVIRAFYQQLVARGKAKMAALTACMRKLLLILNAMLKDNKPWILDPNA